MTRLLGLDLGARRIGVAVADAEGIAMPLVSLRRGASIEDDASAIRRLLEQQGANEVIVGLPIDASGGEGSQAALTREWAEALREHVNATLGYRDERLSSHLAEQRVGPMKRGRSGGPPSRTQREAYRARIDREAAAIILQDELDARARATAHTETT